MQECVEYMYDIQYMYPQVIEYELYLYRTSLLSVVRMSAGLSQLCLLVLSMVAGATLGCPGDVLECPAMVG